MGYKIEVEEKKTYSERMRKNRLIMATIYIILFIIFGNKYSLNDIFSSLTLCFILFEFIYRIKEKYFITDIIYNVGSIEVYYKKKNQSLSLSGNISDFSFKKNIAILTRYRRKCLKIYYQKKLIITQYGIDNWNEALFDSAITNFKIRNH